jgi:interferon gamma-inducible protein 30
MKHLVLFTILLLSTQVSSEKLKIDMMVESLCPDCLHTVTKSFAPAIDQGLFQIADVTFVPYGNAQETLHGSIWSFKCQNTQDECYGNALYSCILHHMTEKQQANKALVCMFTAVNAKSSNFPQSLIDCSKKYNFNASDVKACATNLEGNGLQHQAALATPKHNGVPWPVVEGKFLTNADRTMINENVMKYACRNYVGSVKLPGCEQYAVGDVQKLQIHYFVESLCPDCVHTVGKVNEAIDKGLDYIADVNFVLAGNATVTSKVGDFYEYTCQHGPSECYGNALSSCIWENSPSRIGALYSIACMFDQTHTDGTLLDGALEVCAT